MTSPAFLERLGVTLPIIQAPMIGRPARGLANRLMREIGPLAPVTPAFPHAANALQPLRQAAEARGSGDFSPLWAGQAAAMARPLAAADLTHRLILEAKSAIRAIARGQNQALHNQALHNQTLPELETI